MAFRQMQPVGFHSFQRETDGPASSPLSQLRNLALPFSTQTILVWGTYNLQTSKS